MCVLTRVLTCVNVVNLKSKKKTNIKNVQSQGIGNFSVFLIFLILQIRKVMDQVITSRTQGERERERLTSTKKNSKKFNFDLITSSRFISLS